MRTPQIILVLLFCFSCFADADRIYDPAEKVNRKVFAFNDTLDVYAFEPVAKGYDYVVPHFAQTGVRNFFRNLSYPKYLFSDLCQLKFADAGQHTLRFIINTTAGVVGLVDVAGYAGIEHHETDFGIALAGNGVGPGAYIVLPLLGPSNVRDGLASIVDILLNPLYWLATSKTERISNSTKTGLAYGLTALELINTRARLLDGIKYGKDSSLDFYLFMQGSYYQYREGLLKNGAAKEIETNWDED